MSGQGSNQTQISQKTHVYAASNLFQWLWTIYCNNLNCYEGIKSWWDWIWREMPEGTGRKWWQLNLIKLDTFQFSVMCRFLGKLTLSNMHAQIKDRNEHGNEHGSIKRSFDYQDTKYTMNTATGSLINHRRHGTCMAHTRKRFGLNFAENLIMTDEWLTGDKISKDNAEMSKGFNQFLINLSIRMAPIYCH